MQERYRKIERTAANVDFEHLLVLKMLLLLLRVVAVAAPMMVKVILLVETFAQRSNDDPVFKSQNI